MGVRMYVGLWNFRANLLQFKNKFDKFVETLPIPRESLDEYLMTKDLIWRRDHERKLTSQENYGFLLIRIWISRKKCSLQQINSMSLSEIRLRSLGQEVIQKTEHIYVDFLEIRRSYIIPKIKLMVFILILLPQINTQESLIAYSRTFQITLYNVIMYLIDYLALNNPLRILLQITLQALQTKTEEQKQLTRILEKPRL